MEEDKAPGPDGFPIKFLLACWEVVRDNVFDVFSKFHSRGKWCQSLSATFISLIPKKKGAIELNDSKPISLVGYMYKLLAKTLAIRLKEALVNLISDSQHAFLPRRQLTDCVLITNVNIDAMMRTGWEGVVCKVDMEKTYDHVNWGYVDWALDQMGYSLK